MLEMSYSRKQDLPAILRPRVSHFCSALCAPLVLLYHVAAVPSQLCLNGTSRPCTGLNPTLGL